MAAEISGPIQSYEIPVSCKSLAALGSMPTPVDGANVFVTDAQSFWSSSATLPGGKVASADGSTGVLGPTTFGGFWIQGATSGSGGILSFKTVSAGVAGSGRLVDLPTAQFLALPQGSLAWTGNNSATVPSVLAHWARFSSPTSISSDGFTIVKPLGGASREVWVRLEGARYYWQGRAAYSIDPVAGSDENIGSAGAPLATVAEWIRRVGGAAGNVNAVNAGSAITMTVSIVGDNSEDFAFTWVGSNGSTLIFQGTLPAPAFSDVLSAVTNLNAGTSTPTAATSTWVPATELGRLVHDTTADRWAWVIKDNGASSARMTAWAAIDLNVGAANGAVSIGNAAINDTVSTFVLPKLTGKINIKSLAGDVAGAATNLPSLLIQQFDIAPTISGSFKVGSVGQNVSLQNCKFSAAPSFYGGRINWANCLLNSSGTIFGNFGAVFCQISAGGALGVGAAITPAVNAGSCITVANQACFQNCQWFFRGNSRIRWVDGAIFDTANPITINQSAGRLDITATFWGTGNTGVAIIMNRDSDVTATVGAATMTGNVAGVDFSVAGANTAFPFDPAARTYAAAINCSWANLAAAFGAGGFGGSLFDPGSGCRVGNNTV